MGDDGYGDFESVYGGVAKRCWSLGPSLGWSPGKRRCPLLVCMSTPCLGEKDEGAGADMWCVEVEECAVEGRMKLKMVVKMNDVTTGCVLHVVSRR